ncbi:MAG: thioesterase family protein [Bacteroidota bacterium]|jgi:fluoroacetyl-CoA thioesterase
MRITRSIGDVIELSKTVEETDLATFETGTVHPFYGTFALGRDVEWACRQFVLEMKDQDEEGIGTFLNITHKSPAMLGQIVRIEAVLDALEGNSLDCSFKVWVGDRLVAEGTQGQKILKKEKIERIKQQLLSS